MGANRYGPGGCRNACGPPHVRACSVSRLLGWQKLWMLPDWGEEEGGWRDVVV